MTVTGRAAPPTPPLQSSTLQPPRPDPLALPLPAPGLGRALVPYLEASPTRESNTVPCPGPIGGGGVGAATSVRARKMLSNTSFNSWSRLEEKGEGGWSAPHGVPTGVNAAAPRHHNAQPSQAAHPQPRAWRGLFIRARGGLVRAS